MTGQSARTRVGAILDSITDLFTPTIPSEDGDAESDAALFERGTTIGRFVVLGALGMGGMGMVLSGYDPQLDRKVAIKLLRGDVWRGARAAEGREAIMREAQTMARLSHANVVAVHEVGFIDEGGYVVMEHVEGTTLRVWLKERQPGWHETLDMLMAAGAGLAAAHRAGIVHRDFKPENVLVGQDGRPRVSDFGLARSALRGAGTEGYMAPEQDEHEMVDARADQFSFCVTLWEALQGDRPAAGAPAPPPAPRHAPAWLFRVLARGLSPRPEDRWPSMDDLLAALRRRARLPVAGTLTLVGVVAAVAIVAFLVGRERRSGAVCAGAEARLAGVWDPARREAVRSAFAATGLPFAGTTWNEVSAQLDGYARGWAAMATEACRATRVDGRQSDTLMDLRLACLDRRRSMLSELTSLWARGMDGAALAGAVDAAHGLASLGECADARSLGERGAPPADRAAAVAGARHVVEAARALALARRPAAREAASAAREAADETGWPEVQAEAAVVEGELLVSAADAAAEPALLEAARLAAEAHDDALAARALALLAAGRAGSAARDPQRALLLSDLAAGAAARAGGGGAALQATILRARAAALLAAGQRDAAWTTLVAARVVAGDDVATLRELARVASARGDHGGGRALAEQALAEVVAVYGAQHPRAGELLDELGELCVAAGDSAAAGEAFERALAVAEATSPLLHLAALRRREGRYDDASALLARAATLPDPDAAVVSAVGDLLLARGETSAALDRYRRATTVLERTRDPDDPLVIAARGRVAHALVLLGRCAEAGPQLAPEDAGRCALADRRVAEAATTLERAVCAAGGGSRRAAAAVRAWLAASAR